MDFQSMITQFGALAGTASLIAIIVNVLKQFGVVKDGTSQNWVAGLNLAGLAALISLRVFMPDVDIAALDSQAAQIAVLLAVVAAYISEMGLSKLTHKLLSGVPAIGKSFSKVGGFVMATAINSHDLNNVEQRVTTLEYGHAENKEKIARISDTVFGDDENGGLITAVRVQNSELKTLIETVKSLNTLWAVVIIVLGQVIIIGMGSIFSNQNVSEIFTATMGF